MVEVLIEKLALAGTAGKHPSRFVQFLVAFQNSILIKRPARIMVQYIAQHVDTELASISLPMENKLRYYPQQHAS